MKFIMLTRRERIIKKESEEIRDGSKRKIKVYIDSNLISDPVKIKNFKEEEIEAIEKIKELKDRLKIEIYTSEKTKREINKHQNSKKRKCLKSIYFLISRIPEENII
ncbi:hypothetical protein DRP43_03750, partial [candidate division TA06 bacterium]